MDLQQNEQQEISINRKAVTKRKYKKRTNFDKRNITTEEQKLHIMEEWKNGKSGKTIAASLGLNYHTVESIIFRNKGSMTIHTPYNPKVSSFKKNIRFLTHLKDCKLSMNLIMMRIYLNQLLMLFYIRFALEFQPALYSKLFLELL